MKSISCADMPGNDGTCTAAVTGETTDECIQKMMSHAQGVHADALAGMDASMHAQMSQFMTQFLDARA